MTTTFDATSNPQTDEERIALIDYYLAEIGLSNQRATEREAESEAYWAEIRQLRENTALTMQKLKEEMADNVG